MLPSYSYFWSLTIISLVFYLIEVRIITEKNYDSYNLGRVVSKL